MTSCSKEIEIRHCRPWLGTLVEIAASGTDAAALRPAIDAAFRAVERVQHLMSAQDPGSELSRLNREAAHRPFTVSAETFTVLRRGLALAEASDGAFDFTVAPLLAQWGLLPETHLRPRRGDWQNVRLLAGRRVFFERPVAIDLGGIAKGFAVDLAVEILRGDGVAAGLVNAGGDVRVFGAPRQVHLRHPANGAVLRRSLELKDGALATSSPCFSRFHRQGRTFSHLVNPRTKRAILAPRSVSVRAPECWLVDALTKVVLVDPARSSRLLAHYQAEAFLLAA